MSLATDTLANGHTSPARHEFLDMSAPDAAAAWDDLLSLQIDLSFADELSFLMKSGSLASADSVLDVGCGNGEYLGRLAQFFSRPNWVGIDCAPEMIAAARQRLDDPRLDFLVSDFFAYRPQARHDVVLMRLLVQHLSDLPSVLAHAAECMVPNGRVVLVEPDLENTYAVPGLPAFADMLREHEKATVRNGRLRSQIPDIPSIVRQVGGWNVSADKRIGIPRLGPFAGGSIARMYFRWIELCERSQTFGFPFEGVRTEIAVWTNLPASFAHFGVRIFELRRQPLLDS